MRENAPSPSDQKLGQTHMTGWSRVNASQNGGSIDDILPLYQRFYKRVTTYFI